MLYNVVYFVDIPKFLFAVALTSIVTGEIIQRYLFCTEIEWDYAPGGHDAVALHGSVVDDYITRRSGRIGRRYIKATYMEYADKWYMDVLEKDASAPTGLLGPTIDADVGDTLVVTVRSNLTSRRNCSFHLDTPFSKISHTDVDARTTTTTWLVTPLTAPPTNASHPCTVWLYYSNTQGHMDFNSGLFGPLKVCHRDTTRVDPTGPIALSAILLFAVIDENHSWYLADNLARYCADGSCDLTDPAFIESNRMSGINGYTCGNLPHQPIPSGVLIRWHILMSPTVRRMLTVRLNGHRLSHDGHSVYSVTVYPRTCVTVTVRPTHVGRWLLSTTDSSLTRAGMSGLLDVTPNMLQPFAVSRCIGIRRYFLAAHDVTNSTGHVVGAKIVPYDDFNFSKISQNTSIFAEVGEVIKVIFRNMASKNYSLQAVGLSCDKFSEGVAYNSTHEGIAGGSHEVSPGGTDTYYWQADVWAPPAGSRDPRCVSGSFTMDVVSGGVSAVGLVVMCQRDTRHNHTTDVKLQTKKQLWLKVGKDMQSYEVDNEKVSMDFCAGEVITVHVTSEKTRGDPDLVWAPGYRLLVADGSRNAMVVSPGASLSGSLLARKPGKLDIRMTSASGATRTLAEVRIAGCSNQSSVNPKTASSATTSSLDTEPPLINAPTASKRTKWGERVVVFLAAELIRWDYGDGRKYKKAYFTRYLDGSFRRLYRTLEEPNVKLGFVGPTLRANVGERLTIFLKNRVKSNRFNIAILKREPAEIDAPSGVADPSKGVPAPRVFAYSWYIDDTFANSDLPCTTHAYVSDINGNRDINAGLVGHLIVCKSRTHTSDVKDYIAVVMGEFDEKRSTLRMFNNVPTNAPPIPSINGYARNISGPLLPAKATVTWYIVSVSARLKWLTFAGSTITSDCPVSPTSFVLPLFPYQSLTVITTTPSSGAWSVDCGKPHKMCWSIRCMSYVTPTFSYTS